MNREISASKMTRGQCLRSLAAGSSLLPGLLSELLAEDSGVRLRNPLAPGIPDSRPRASRVIMLYMSGGVSHVDTWDPRPKLMRDAGKTVTVNEFQGRKGSFSMYLKSPQWTFRPRGTCGTQVSDLFPRTAACVDDLCVIRSMKSNHTNHYEATLGMHTGSFTFARPSMGSWISYGLGTLNRNLPSFIVLAPQTPYAGGQVWGSDFLPGTHQGTRVVPGSEPVANIQRRAESEELQRLELGLLARMNQRHRSGRGDDALLEARMQSFETAFGMQKEMPEVFDLSDETESTFRSYGLEPGSTAGFAWQCLIARRLAERGVRFVELIDTGSDTLVVWTTEFGRTPFNAAPQAAGREHHHWVFSSWLAGGGVRGGMTWGASDDYGIEVAADEVHVHDFHATILHLLGLDHTRLTWRNSGRDFRLTDVHGRVVQEILS